MLIQPARFANQTNLTELKWKSSFLTCSNLQSKSLIYIFDIFFHKETSNTYRYLQEFRRMGSIT